MKTKKAILILLIFGFVTVATTWAQQGCQVTAYGTVTDISGQPVAGATVIADTSATTTSSLGGYSISRIQINCNSMYVRVSAEGYITQTKYTPGGDGSYNLDFVLEPEVPGECFYCTSTVSGYVRDEQGNPITGAEIITLAPTGIYTATDGSYAVDVTVFDSENSTGICPVNDLFVSVEAAGYNPSELFVPAETCSTQTKDFTMSAATFYGDSSGDGVVNIVDALMIARFYIGFTDNGFIQSNSDVNSDGQITIVDALVVAQYYVGLITELPIN